MVIGWAAGTTAAAVQPRSSENSPSNTVATNVGNSTMRPAASHAARPEPMPTATEKTVRNNVTTCSLPPMLNETSGGNSDSTSAPTSQNQLATSAPHIKRGSSRTCLMREAVETKTLGLIARPGAAWPVLGINRLQSQLASAVTIIIQAKWTGLLLPLAAMPATMVPNKMARKVPASISALPDGSWRRSSRSGRMPYLIGPNSDASIPNRNTARNSNASEWKAKPATATMAAPISTNLMRWATQALS